MTFYRFLKFFFGMSVGGWFIILFAPWPAVPVVYHQENFQCAIPANWSIKRTKLFVMDAHRLLGGTFCVQAKPIVRTYRADDPRFINAYRNKLVADGFEIVSQDEQPFLGHPTYEITFRKVINGRLIYTHAINFIAGRFRYDLVLAKKGGDPMDDRQLRDALNSFALLDPSS